MRLQSNCPSVDPAPPRLIVFEITVFAGELHHSAARVVPTHLEK
jgi:hypothetical protein